MRIAPHEYGPSKVGHGEAQCIWCLGTYRENAVLSSAHCTTRAAVDPKFNSKSLIPTSQWSARVDIPLNALLKQMLDTQTSYVEIAMGSLIVGITLSPPHKHAAVKDAILKVMKE